MRQFAVSVVVALGVARGAEIAVAAPEPAPPDKIDRLVGLAQVWSKVKYFHPEMFQRTIDWDAALIKAIPAVEAASDDASYRAAIEAMLVILGDRRTTAAAIANPGDAASAWKSWAPHDVLVIDARRSWPEIDYMATRRRAADARAELARAKVAVIDLRAAGSVDVLDYLLGSLPATQTWPTVRTIRHEGFRSQGETNRDTYTTSWNLASGGAPTGGAGPGPSHVVLVVGGEQQVPLAAVALWTSGHATLVAANALDDAAAAPTITLALPYGVAARVRVGDVLLPGDRSLAADAMVPAGADPRARAIEIASAIAAGRPPPRAAVHRTAPSSALQLADDDDAPATGLPSRERRILAAVRVWAAVEYFHGVGRLNHGWEQELRKVLPRLDAVTQAQAYVDELNAMLAALHDGHTGVYNQDERARRASTAIYWRRIDGKVAAGGFRDEAAARQAGIALGDELVGVDGVAVEQAIASLRRITSSGTEEALQQWAAAIVDRGARGTSVELDVRSASGKLRRVALRRDYGYDNNFWAHQGPHFRVLPDQIGYADLTRLTSDEVDAMFEALAQTRAIVFDMRGYPGGTAWLIGARINTRQTHVLSEIRTPIVTARASSGQITKRILQPAPATDKPLYRGKIIVLIDDRAVSAAEHLCLIFEATGGAKFVGSPTNGTNGEETYVRLPGGVEARFTGMEILHADGRQLQQIGIQPDVAVRPTLRGLRAGQDEVLDRAILYVQRGR